MNDPATTGSVLASDIVWVERDFPNANFLLLLGDEPTLVDTGFVSHARATTALAAEHTPRVSRVVNTHWHSDHVGGNASLQGAGAQILGSAVDGAALDRVDPGCCLAQYLDQPVPPYSIDRALVDGERVRLGEREWQVLEIPGHTPGHLAFWEPADRLLAVGDALSSYDVGWVNVMHHGGAGIDDSLASLRRLRELDARVVLPGHGPLLTEAAGGIDKAIARMERQRADLDAAVGYGARRILAFALMIRGGIRVDALGDYLAEREWARDAAAVLDQQVDVFARELVDSMVSSGALVVADGTVRPGQAAEPVDPAVFDIPFPKDWPAPDQTSGFSRTTARP